MHSRVLSKDEELGKRDDDFRPKRQASGGLNPLRWRKRRILSLIAGLVLVYLFVHNIPTDLGPVNERLAPQWRPAPLVSPPGAQNAGSSNREPSGAPPKPRANSDDLDEKHYYNGKIKFFRLASSLHAISRTMGTRPTNRNVLFAASSLKSVANLMPMACDMAKWDRNYVQFGIMGRDALSMEEILQINGFSTEDCDVMFHDARSDYSEYSSDQRLEIAVGGALKHMNDFMHPQAIITDDSLVEDAPFTRAMRMKGKELGHPVIEIPSGGYEDFLWMTRLDSGSLANWFKPRIDILIHAPKESSGGLIRLIKSLESADYEGLRPPRLTVELPSSIEPAARSYLQGLRWPPGDQSNPLEASTLTLRHRIPSQHATSEQASLRFIESFYPPDDRNNHVLILSPQVEVSPQYLKYLQYTILEYRYASYGAPNAAEMLGFSLDIPSSFINGNGELVQPGIADMNARRYTDDKQLDMTAHAPFLYQAPSSSATLIFGEKWAEFHNYLSNRVAASHVGKVKKTKKLVSETEPSWMEYLLELMRSRNWAVMHPATAFVTVHNELAQVPEEYTRPKGDGQKGAEVLKQSDHPEEEPFLTADEAPVLVPHVERERSANSLPLHQSLPFDGDLPELPHLPFLDPFGQLSRLGEMDKLRNAYLTGFREHIGGCDAKDAKRKRVVHPGNTDDLFCLPGMEPDYDDAPEAEDEEANKALADAIAKATDPDPHAAKPSKEAVKKADEKATVETEEEVKKEAKGVD